MAEEKKSRWTRRIVIAMSLFGVAGAAVSVASLFFDLPKARTDAGRAIIKTLWGRRQDDKATRDPPKPPIGKEERAAK